MLCSGRSVTRSVVHHQSRHQTTTKLYHFNFNFQRQYISGLRHCVRLDSLSDAIRHFHSHASWLAGWLAGCRNRLKRTDRTHERGKHEPFAHIHFSAFPTLELDCIWHARHRYGCSTHQERRCSLW